MDECIYERKTGFIGLFQGIIIRSLKDKPIDTQVRSSCSWSACFLSAESVTPDGVAGGFMDWSKTVDFEYFLFVAKSLVVIETCYYYGLIGGFFAFMCMQFVLAERLERALCGATTDDKNPKVTTPLELARLAHQAYDEIATPMLGPWVLEKRYYAQKKKGNDMLSFGPDVYVDAKLKRLVISARGTDTGMVGHLVEDWKLLKDKINSFLFDCTDGSLISLYTQRILTVMASCEAKYPDYEWYLTGHSLGASCCEAAWTIHFAERMESDEKHQAKLWSCITWESPGFYVGERLSGILNDHPDLVDKHVRHYLGAPNAINCLHPHIGKNNIYRVHLEHDNRLSVSHIYECVSRDISVALNWVFLLRITFGVVSKAAARAGFKAVTDVGNMKLFQAVQSAESQVHCIARARAPQMTLMEDYTSRLIVRAGNLVSPAAITLTKDFSRVLTTNAIAHGILAVKYLLQQHSLANHISSFDPESGNPRNYVRMTSWPAFHEQIQNSAYSMFIESIIPPSPMEHANPALMIETKIKRLRGYKEAKQLTPCLEEIRGHYPEVNALFPDEAVECDENVLTTELRFRKEYERSGKRVPQPLLFVST